jgi:peptide/nickel transport system permease protein
MWLMPVDFHVIGTMVFLIFWYSIARYIWKYAGRVGKKLSIPLDSIIMRAIDIFESFPKFIIVDGFNDRIEQAFCMDFIHSHCIDSVDTLFAQMARNETIKESVANYVLAAENISIPWHKILIRHIWPNIKSVIWVTAVFTFSASVLIEASLSFIGLGLRLERVTWGSLLNEGRQYFPGWWLSVFPGLAIFSLLFALNWLFIIKTRNEKVLGSTNI